MATHSSNVIVLSKNGNPLVCGHVFDKYVAGMSWLKKHYPIDTMPDDEIMKLFSIRNFTKRAMLRFARDNMFRLDIDEQRETYKMLLGEILDRVIADTANGNAIPEDSKKTVIGTEKSTLTLESQK